MSCDHLCMSTALTMGDCVWLLLNSELQWRSREDYMILLCKRRLPYFMWWSSIRNWGETPQRKFDKGVSYLIPNRIPDRSKSHQTRKTRLRTFPPEAARSASGKDKANLHVFTIAILAIEESLRGKHLIHWHAFEKLT